ncbi:hypothetical protein ACX1N5_04055 [Acinetobacter sp. ANC 4636]
MAKKSNAGRPSRYKQEYCVQAYKLCLLGSTDKQMANFFGVAESTINKWKIDHSEFSESIKRGKEIADMEIANSLHERAKGVKIKKKQAIKLKRVEYAFGKRVLEEERIEIVEVEEELPPDTTAAIFWLKNRNPDQWRDKQQHELTGKDGGSIDLSMKVVFEDDGEESTS